MWTNNGKSTLDKEAQGQQVIKTYRLFDTLFPNNEGYRKITTKKKQKAGVDYEVYMPGEKEPIYVDLKCLVGVDYSMTQDDYAKVNDSTEAPIRRIRSKGVTLEVYQNKVFTYTKGKLTDYLLWVIIDKDGIFYYNMKYEDAHNICLAYKKESTIVDGICYWHYPEKNIYKVHTSANKSGEYIKYPINAIKVEDTVRVE